MSQLLPDDEEFCTQYSLKNDDETMPDASGFLLSFNFYEPEISIRIVHEFRQQRKVFLKLPQFIMEAAL